jgi:CheY-like chemotaxis protein
MMGLSALRRVSMRLGRRWIVGFPAAGGLQVLIVTGDAGLRSTAEQLLQREGHGVTCAAHSGHALLACLDGRRIDVAFIETALEDMPGTALADRLRRHLPNLRVVFLAEAGTRPAPGVVSRPLTSTDLLAELAVVTSAMAS